MASSRTLKVKSTRITGPTTVTAPLASFDDEEEDFVPPPGGSRRGEGGEEGAPDRQGAAVAALEGQVGKTIDVKITSVDGTKIVVSERALAQERGAKALEVGVRVSGVIVSLSDFGAFVELSEDDPQAPRMEGLIHISELSWNRISHPRDVVRVGDEVDVKVLDVAPGQGNKPARVTFSLKTNASRPLLETLDTIMPVAMPEPSMDEDELLDTPLPGLMDICANLLTEDGIDAVIPGRQAVEQRVVSQDLELWLTNAVVADGYNLLARGKAGAGDPRGDRPEPRQHQARDQEGHQRDQEVTTGALFFHNAEKKRVPVGEYCLGRVTRRRADRRAGTGAAARERGEKRWSAVANGKARRVVIDI